MLKQSWSNKVSILSFLNLYSSFNCIFCTLFVNSVYSAQPSITLQVLGIELSSPETKFRVTGDAAPFRFDQKTLGYFSGFEQGSKVQKSENPSVSYGFTWRVSFSYYSFVDQ